MKLKNYVSIAMISLSLLAANESHAAFAVKKDAAKTTVVAQNPQMESAAVTSSAMSADNAAGTFATETKVAKKHSFFSKIADKISAAKDAAIPKVAYVILAIIGLGWLAMGINDSFGDFDWVLSLILYIIFYIPGLIYTLIKMKKYY